MSVISLLSVRSLVDLKQMLQELDFGQLGISLGDGVNLVGASGSIIFCGVAFTYELQPFTAPKAAHHIFCSADLTGVAAAMHLDLGPAVASGRTVPAVVQVLLELGKVIGCHLDINAVLWSPANVASGFDYYTEAVTQYADGGAFPALLCVGFDTSKSGTVQTTGLAWLCGQELTFEHAQLPTHAAMRYVVRLVHDLATQGAYDRALEVPGLQVGEVVVVAPGTDKDRVFASLATGKEGIKSSL